MRTNLLGNIFIIIILGIQIISKQNKTYRYFENDIENYLLPKPQIIHKGNKSIEIHANETQIKFIQEHYASENHDNKNIEFLENIKNLYLKIFKEEYKTFYFK